MSSAFEYSKEHLYSNRVHSNKILPGKNVERNQCYNKMKFDIHVVFAGGRKMKIFSTVFRDLGKYMLRKWYFQE